ncbi:MAG: hypothetical protein II846_01930 [Acetobacter sp.]|nr:hypothetical protein [Acetobacter sp.]
MTRTSAQIPIIVCASPQQTTEPFIWRLFKDEDELRRLWGNPETRRTLLTALEERGFGKEALKNIRAMVANDKSDLFDVLAYIAFARPTMTRQERADAQKNIFSPRVMINYVVLLILCSGSM